MLVPMTYQVKVSARRVESDSVVSLTMTRPEGRLPRWDPGAHIDLMFDNGLVRQYSLSSDPADRHLWRIGVLRELQGRGGSEYIHGNVVPGHIVRVSTPRNNFQLHPAERYIFIAGGIGITPILPMVARAESAGAHWSLLYGGRTRASMAFLDELEQYGDKVSIVPQDELGLLDLAASLSSPSEGTQVYVCGPAPLLNAVESHMTAWPPTSLHIERFTPTGAADDSANYEFLVEFANSSVTASIPPEKSILEVAEELDLSIASSCGIGTCGTCSVGMISGRADHRDSILSGAEREANSTILVCVSRARPDCTKLVLDL